MPAIDIVKRFYANFLRGDIDAATADCAEDMHFLWVANPLDTPYSGPFEGKQAFKAQLHALRKTFEYRDFVLVDIVATDDRVAVRAEIPLTRRTTRSEFVAFAADFWTVRDGSIVEVIEYYDTALVARYL